MIEDIGKNLINLKKKFMTTYDGQSQIQEVIPLSKSELFPIVQTDLELLHEFAKTNPIYYNQYEKTIGNTACVVYEGDINKYWLNSIQHGSSHAPFSPTWIMSAYVCILFAKKFGYSEIIDIGSGDGRIAFCAKILDLESYSIEIDEMLVELQKDLCSTLDFNPHCSDATVFDYSSLKLTKPIFFIGGLAQMGGTSLASGVFDKVSTMDSIRQNSGWVFAGTYSKKYLADPKNEAGWGMFIEKNSLKSVQTVSLPTAWTFRESDETPYIFTQPR